MAVVGHAGDIAPVRDRDLYKIYVIGVIWFVLLLRFVDIQIMSILLEPIRQEFGFSDTQLGLLTGFAFAIFYGTLGIPIAWLADRYNRRNIIAISLGLWSMMTALCGTASGYASLFLLRMGVGVGEAGGVPPSYSLVSNYVEEKRRPTVFAILNTAVPIGVFVGFIVGGWVSEWVGWRAAFLVVGIPGVILALVVRFTLREPPRPAPTIADSQQFNLRATIRYLAGQRSYLHLVAASSLLSMGAAGSGAWIPSFFVRTHGMSVGEIGTWLAFVYGGGGLVGALAGGMLCDRIREKTGDARWSAWLPAITTLAILPTAVFVYLWPNPIQALLVQVVGALMLHAWMGPCYGTIQTLAGEQRRAMAAAVNLLMINLIAYGMGPFLIGLASDLSTARFGEDSLRYCILTLVLVTFAWSALHFVLAARSIRGDLQKIEAKPAA